MDVLEKLRKVIFILMVYHRRTKNVNIFQFNETNYIATADEHGVIGVLLGG